MIIKNDNQIKQNMRFVQCKSATCIHLILLSRHLCIIPSEGPCETHWGAHLGLPLLQQRLLDFNRLQQKSSWIFAKKTEHPLLQLCGGLARDDREYHAGVASLHFSLGSCEGPFLPYCYYPFYTYDLINITVSWWGYKNHLTSYQGHWCHCETYFSAYVVCCVYW